MPFPSLCKVLFMIKPEDRERLETELKINRKKVLCCCEKCMAKFNFDEDTMLHDRVLNLENPGWLTKKTGKNHGCWKCYDWSDLLLMMQQQLEDHLGVHEMPPRFEGYPEPDERQPLSPVKEVNKIQEDCGDKRGRETESVHPEHAFKKSRAADIVVLE